MKKNSNNKSGNIKNLKNIYLKKGNIKNNRKPNLNNGNAYLLTSNISSFNPIEESKDILLSENNIAKSHNKNNKNQKTNKHKRDKSIDADANQIGNVEIEIPIHSEQNLIRINTININKNNNNSKKYKITINKLPSPTVSNYGKYECKEESKKNIDSKYSCFYLNKKCSNSGFLINKNSKFEKKILSAGYSPVGDKMKKKINFNIGKINIKSYNSNDFLDNLKQYFLNKNISINSFNKNNNNNNENNQIYEPFDLNCIFFLPRKTVKEKMMKIFENIKCKVKQINPYKYNIVYRNNKDIYELSLPLNNEVSIIKFKKNKSFNGDYINNTRKFIQALK